MSPLEVSGFSLAVYAAAAQTPVVSSPIVQFVARGRRVSTSFKYAKGSIPRRRQHSISVYTIALRFSACASRMNNQFFLPTTVDWIDRSQGFLSISTPPRKHTFEAPPTAQGRTLSLSQSWFWEGFVCAFEAAIAPFSAALKSEYFPPTFVPPSRQVRPAPASTASPTRKDVGFEAG